MPCTHRSFVRICGLICSDTVKTYKHIHLPTYIATYINIIHTEPTLLKRPMPYVYVTTDLHKTAPMFH